MKNNIWVSFLLCTLVACDSGRVYERFKELEGNWHQDSAAVFTFQPPNDTSKYSLIGSIVNDNEYPYYNLYVEFILKNSEDSIISQSLEEITFFNPKTGSPYGNGSGDKFEHQFIIREEFVFPENDTYTVSFRQFMRVQELPAIQRIGFRLEYFQVE